MQTIPGNQNRIFGTTFCCVPFWTGAPQHTPTTAPWFYCYVVLGNIEAMPHASGQWLARTCSCESMSRNVRLLPCAESGLRMRTIRDIVRGMYT